MHRRLDRWHTCLRSVSLIAAVALSWLATGAAAQESSSMHGASMTAAMQAAPPNADEREFFAQDDAAMQVMMRGMAIRPSGDVDQDFVAMMSAHHQGAIDMANALLAHSHNEALRRLAQEIIVTQQEEIAAMRLAVTAATPAQHH